MEKWLPIPTNSNVWDRAFRIEIDNINPDNPVLNVFIERAYSVGDNEVVTKLVPELYTSISMSEAILDDEISFLLTLPMIEGLQEISKLLWSRKLNSQENA